MYELSNSDERKKFKKFLIAKGAELLEPTNEYELFRFLANGTIGLVYINGRKNVSSWNECALRAYEAYKHKKPYTANKISKRVRKNYVLYTLIKRDGYDCFYCQRELIEGEMTIEHLLSITMGGKNHLANLTVACQQCNQEAGHMTVIDKIKLRERYLRAI